MLFVLWWLYYVSSKNITKLKMFKISLQLYRFVALYSLDLKLIFLIIALTRKGKY